MSLFSAALFAGLALGFSAGIHEKHTALRVALFVGSLALVFVASHV